MEYCYAQNLIALLINRKTYSEILNILPEFEDLDQVFQMTSNDGQWIGFIVNSDCRSTFKFGPYVKDYLISQYNNGIMERHCSGESIIELYELIDEKSLFVINRILEIKSYLKLCGIYMNDDQELHLKEILMSDNVKLKCVSLFSVR